jgi:hypothetical protein
MSAKRSSSPREDGRYSFGAAAAAVAEEGPEEEEPGAGAVAGEEVASPLVTMTVAPEAVVRTWKEGLSGLSMGGRKMSMVGVNERKRRQRRRGGSGRLQAGKTVEGIARGSQRVAQEEEGASLGGWRGEIFGTYSTDGARRVAHIAALPSPSRFSNPSLLSTRYLTFTPAEARLIPRNFALAFFFSPLFSKMLRSCLALLAFSLAPSLGAKDPSECEVRRSLSTTTFVLAATLGSLAALSRFVSRCSVAC